MTHKLIDDVPLWAAAATQRGPRTVAILKSNTSQKPMALGNCLIGSAAPPAAWLTESRPARESVHPACGNCGETDLWNFRSHPRARKMPPGRPVGKPRYRQVFLPGACRASRRRTCGETRPSDGESGRPYVRP